MEKVYFTNKKGHRLAGLLFQAAKKDRPVVIVCHGFTGSKEGRGSAVEMAVLLQKKGFSTLLFDFAGCGESQGRFEELTLSGHIDDLTCALDFCLEKGLGPAVTLGRSFGGTTAICQAAFDTRVKGVCTWAAPASLLELFLGLTDQDLPGDEDSLVTLAGSEGVIYLKRSFFTDLSSYDVLSCASLVSPRPVLVIQGTRDEVVPPAEAAAIFSSAGHPRDLILVEGADHQFSAHHREVWAIFMDWLGKNFKL